jgi:hypothetical protein
VLRTREKDLIDELNRMKVEKGKLSKDRVEMESTLGDLLAEFNKKKDKELQAKWEKEEIARALRQIEKSKLTALENDRHRELKRLSAERENIRLQEEALHE